MSERAPAATRLFVANWKMHKTRAEARDFARDLAGRMRGLEGRELVIAPAFPLLDAARDPEGRWGLACQNVATEVSGAFTGEVSARMAADAGCGYAIVGHSERRRLFGEDSAALAKKLARSREAGLTPIYCVGETAPERDAGATAAVLRGQLATLEDDPAGEPLVVAYEPVWAIGTGRAATPEDSAAASVHITQLLTGRPHLRLLYGGSVSAENAGELLARGSVNGFLVGGASLSAAAFAAIASV